MAGFAARCGIGAARKSIPVAWESEHGGPGRTAGVAGRLDPALLSALDHLEAITRHMHPPHLPQLAASLDPDDHALTEALSRVRDAAWPEELGSVS